MSRRLKLALISGGVLIFGVFLIKIEVFDSIAAARARKAVSLSRKGHLPGAADRCSRTRGRDRHGLFSCGRQSHGQTGGANGETDDQAATDRCARGGGFRSLGFRIARLVFSANWLRSATSPDNSWAFYCGRRSARLGRKAGQPRAVEPPEHGRVVVMPQVGGLHHRYVRRAA